MKNILKTLLLFFILLSSCTEKKETVQHQSEQFTSELKELKEYFKIPGLAVSVEKDGSTICKEFLGVADVEHAKPVSSSTLFPIASLTKVFTGVLVMKLVEQKNLSLDDPIDRYLSKPMLGDSILVKHVLSHTSQGNPGETFYYSSRFGLLTSVIEKASGKSFEEMLKQKIFLPLKLDNTFLLKDSTQISRIATPYILENGIEKGFIDYGYSASAGIVSNTDDLTTFNTALDNNSLISQESKEIMYSSFKDGLPYGYGIFNQQIENVDIIWAYGQYDCYSSLLLRVPSENITLTLLANNNLLSDPARLIYGDVTSSLFAMSFLKNYVFGLSDMSLLENQDSVSLAHTHKEFHRKKILGQALAESYMARYEPAKQQSSAKLLNHIFNIYPDYPDYGNLNLLHNLSFLKDISFYMELDEFNDFDTHIESIGKKLLDQDPDNPYANSYLGTYYARKGDIEKAKTYFGKIINATNFSKNWYTNEAQQWLKEFND